MRIKVKVGQSAKWYLDENQTYGVEVTVYERKWISELQISTFNTFNESDTTTRIYIPNIFQKPRLLKYLMKICFKKIKYKYISWGAEESISFPFKNQ